MVDATPQPKKNQGEPLPRIDAQMKVTGAARFPADFPMQNLAHAALAVSPIASGEITAVHLERARKVPGVIEILSIGDAAQIGPPQFGTSSTSIQPLKDRKIWHDGQIVALVLAETFEAATEAAQLVRADYAAKIPAATFGSPGVETVAAKDAGKQHKEDPAVGDFDAAFAASPVKMDAEYQTPAMHHNPIELFSTTAMWEGEKLTVYEPTQSVTGWKNEIARQLKIDPQSVRVVSPYIGGAFGSKGPITSRTALVALAAKLLRRPVRCVVPREQAYSLQTYRAETKHRIRMGAERSGKITAFAHEGWEVTSRPDPYVVAGTSTTSRMYGYGSVWTEVSLVRADRNTPGYMRSPPETPYVYALENAMDEMAVTLGMDPVEFRRVNDIDEEPIDRKPFSSRSLMQCYDQAAEAFGWSKRKPGVGAMREGDWLIGMGCATAIYPTNVAPCTARVRFTADGKVRVQTASHEIGTGVRTVAGQMAAERLGVNLDQVEVEMGDSALPPAPVSGGSLSTASVCSVVLQACNAIRTKLFSAVTGNEGPLVGHRADDLDLCDGQIIVKGGGSAKLAGAFKALKSGAIEEYAEFLPEGAKPEALSGLYKGESPVQSGEKGDKVKYAFGAEFVEVRINRRTREVRVQRMVGAFAAGRIMNTRTARSQLMGGMIWGVGQALHEITEVDRRAARYVNRDLQDYLIPVNADIQEVEVILVPEIDHEVNPAGVKGLGELGNVGTAAAIASAVYHATGIRIRNLPIRVESMLA